MPRYRLMKRAFHGGSLREPGSVISLTDGEAPDAHMVKLNEPDIAVGAVTLAKTRWVGPPGNMAAAVKSDDESQTRWVGPAIVSGPGNEPVIRHADPIISKTTVDLDLPFRPGEAPPIMRGVSEPALHKGIFIPAEKPNVFPTMDIRQPAPTEVIETLVRPPADLGLGLVNYVTYVAPRETGYFVFDTETNGLRNPRMASIAMIFVDENLDIECEISALIRPDGWEMESGATAVNGLTDEHLLSHGSNGAPYYWLYKLAVDSGRTLVAHNAVFDLGVMKNESDARGMPAPLQAPEAVCTMKAARKVCGKGKLTEAYELIRGEPLDDAHSALADARGCLEILRAVRARGLDFDAFIVKRG